MSGHSAARLVLKGSADFSGPSAARLLFRRGMRLDLTSYEFITGIADALRADYGDSASTVKAICEDTGAAPGTVKKWLALENGPGGEMLLKLMAASSAVRRFTDVVTKREDLVAKKEQQLRRALALMEGREDP